MDLRKFLRFRVRFIIVFCVGYSVLAGSASGDTLFKFDFKRADSLESWEPFQEGQTPALTVTESGHLRGARSEGSGLVALSHSFDFPQERIAVDFRLAVSGGKGRVFHLWTQEPGGSDASQLNLCVQNNGSLQQYDGLSRTWENVGQVKIPPIRDESKPVWTRIEAVLDWQSSGISIRVSEPGSDVLPEKPTAVVSAYRTHLMIDGISFVSGSRIAEEAFYLIDELSVRGGSDLPDPGPGPALPETFPLWSGPELPADPADLPAPDGVEHRLIHRPDPGGYKFLHGATILEHDGVFYANWAASPVNENSADEVLHGKRSPDGGKTWSDLEVVGPGFDGPDRHSHGVLFESRGEVWTICARFGVGEPGKKFRGLEGEAFVLNSKTDKWESRGIVMENCWPCDEPSRMGNGNFISGGLDKDGLPVAVISQGTDFGKMWKTVPIPFHPKLSPSFAETSVTAHGEKVMAVIRGGRGDAWIAVSEDSGESWKQAMPATFPMPRAKAYLGRLSTGEMYLISNLKNRDTLVISTGAAGEFTLDSTWRLRHGRTEAPKYPGFAKSPQWSYPYAYEFDRKLWVVYSIGKEECGLTIVPLSSIRKS